MSELKCYIIPKLYLEDSILPFVTYSGGKTNRFLVVHSTLMSQQVES